MRSSILPLLFAGLMAGASGLFAASEETPRPPRPEPVPYVVFYQGDRPVARTLETRTLQSFDGKPLPIKEQAAALTAALLSGPSAAKKAQGWASAFPQKARLDGLDVVGQRVTVRLSMPDDFLTSMTLTQSERMTKAFVETLSWVKALHIFDLEVRPLSQSSNEWHPLDHYLSPLPPVISKRDFYGGEAGGGASSRSLAQPPGFGHDQAAGSLSGKTVFLSPGHGWYWHTSNGWITQRGNTNDIVEDFVSTEGVAQFLVPYLWNAGADVWVARERGLTETELIVDNDGGNTDGTYSETGAWFDSSLAGFAHGSTPYTTENPFDLDGNRLLGTDPSGTDRAVWTFAIPSGGFYPVYVSYSQFTSRAPDAHYIVKHSGGENHFYLNQTFHGFTWRYLGTFYFEAGAPASEASVELQNDSAFAGTYVSADAVRLGAGMGNIDSGAGVSGEPRFEECARYYTQYLGAPASVYQSMPLNNDADVTARPRWAEWEVDASEDAVYVAWHTNAPDPGTGTSSFIYNGGFTAGSDTLQSAIHDELINDIRAGWDAGWTDRGKQQANFGEVRLLSTMPGTLLELAFHDTPADAADLKEAKFRLLASRAIAQGIMKYFDVNAVLPPEPPESPRVLENALNTVRVAWDAPPTDAQDLRGDAAASYKVYQSPNGRGFDNGLSTTDTWLDIALTPGQVTYFKVTALNDGGESFATETLAARLSGGSARLLIVNGFDRIDPSALIWQNESAALGDVRRMFLRKMNTFDYVIAHADAAAAAGVDFVSASNEAVENADVALTDFCGVLWISGEESSADETFSPAEQALVSAYLAQGGHLMVSGAELGWDLDWLNGGRTFYQSDLKALYRDDDPYTGASPAPNLVSGVPGGIFDGLSGMFFDNGTGDVYNVDYPDALDPNGGATLDLVYDASGEAYTGAGVVYSGVSRVVTLGFPFESLTQASDRAALLDRVMSFFTFTTPVASSIPDLMLVKSGNDLALSWSAPGNTLFHRVYRSMNPQGPFDAGADVSALDGDSFTTNAAYTETDGLSGNPDGVWYYQVLGENCSGLGPF